MLRRLYFLVPDRSTAREIVGDLLLARVEARRIHVLAKRGKSLDGLPEASLLQKTDFVPGAQRGLALGGLAGAAAGLVTVLSVSVDSVVAGGVILASALSGAAFGVWIGGMLGMNVRNTRLAQFDDAIDHGHLLLMVDTRPARVGAITERITSHYPGAEARGSEPIIPAFP